MSEETKKDALRELSEFVAGPKIVHVGGKDYTLAPLRPIDLAEARDYVVKNRVQHFLETVRHMALLPGVIGDTISKIECADLSIFEVTHDAGGRLKLIHSAIKRGGENIPMIQLEQKMDPTSQDQLYAWCMWVSGCLPEPPTSDGEADEGPL